MGIWSNRISLHLSALVNVKVQRSPAFLSVLKAFDWLNDLGMRLNGSLREPIVGLYNGLYKCIILYC